MKIKEFKELIADLDDNFDLIGQVIMVNGKCPMYPIKTVAKLKGPNNLVFIQLEELEPYK